MNKEQIRFFLLGFAACFIACGIFYFNRPEPSKDVILTIMHPKSIGVMKDKKLVGNVDSRSAIQFLFKGLTVTVGGDTVKNINVNLVEVK